MQPHWQQTRASLQREAVVLLVQDTTEIDLSMHATMAGLGQVGNAKGRGFLLQTVLAVVPATQAVLGCLAQKPFVRLPAPPNEQRYQRCHRGRRETDVWMQMVEQVGAPGEAGVLVHVGDRGADMLPFFRCCLSTQTHFLVRAAQNRRVQASAEEIGHLFDQVRVWPSQDQRPFAVPASHGHHARQTTLQISFGPATLMPPWTDPRGSKDPLPVWAVRVWELEAPAGEEALAWMLLTSLETATQEDAWQRVEWYRCRWMVEAYHQCLKTGCRLEERHVQAVARLIRLLGLLSPIAVRLLQLRAVARLAPESAAVQLVEPAAVAIIAASVSLPPEQLTGAAFWQEVARLGGYLGRRRDGPPGWKTLWQGGSIYKPCWRVLIWQLISVGKMWVKDRVESRGLSRSFSVTTVLIVTPGPDTALVTRNALRAGSRAASLTTFGIGAGSAVWAFASILGLAVLLDQSVTIFTIFKLVGAAYLGYLGIKSLLALRGNKQIDAATPLPEKVQMNRRTAFRQGLLSNLLNPKAGAIFATVWPTFIPPDASPWRLVLMLIAYETILLLWLQCYGYLASLAGQSRFGKRVRTILQGVTGVVLLALGVRLALEQN